MVDKITSQTLYNNGRKYNQPQHEPLLCPTLNSNDREYNNNNMNHYSVKP